MYTCTVSGAVAGKGFATGGAAPRVAAPEPQLGRQGDCPLAMGSEAMSQIAAFSHWKVAF